MSEKFPQLTVYQVDFLLERFDQTHIELQREIVAQLMVRTESQNEHIAELAHQVERLRAALKRSPIKWFDGNYPCWTDAEIDAALSAQKQERP